jgi:hypothetical protein
VLVLLPVPEPDFPGGSGGLLLNAWASTMYFVPELEDVWAGRGFLWANGHYRVERHEGDRKPRR